MTADLQALARRFREENIAAAVRMERDADDVRRVIRKHGDPGGHLDRMATILTTAAEQILGGAR